MASKKRAMQMYVIKDMYIAQEYLIDQDYRHGM